MWCVAASMQTTSPKWRMLGTLIGAFIMGLLSNGSDLLGTNPYWQQVIIMAVLQAVASRTSD